MEQKAIFWGAFCVTQWKVLLRSNYSQRSKITTPNEDICNTSEIHEHVYFFD